MKGKYYVTNIYVEGQKKRNKRRQILKRIRCACVIVDIIIFLAILGIVGGLERDILTIKEFMGYSLVAVLVLWASFAIMNELEGK
jgi:hypothetical protein